MKKRSIFRKYLLQACCMGLAVPCSFMLATSAQAADIVKANNTNALNLGTSWTGGTAPGSGDIAVWDSTITAGNSSALSANVSWGGIRVGNVGGSRNNASNVNSILITGSGSTLTLGGSGIDMSSALQALQIQSRITIGANQTWNIADANNNASPFGGGFNEDLYFSAQAANTAMNLGGNTVSTTGAGSIGITSGYQISNGTFNVGNAGGLLIQSGGSRITTLDPNLTINVASGSKLRIQANSSPANGSGVIEGSLAVDSSAAININGGTFEITSAGNNQNNRFDQKGKLSFTGNSTVSNTMTSVFRTNIIGEVALSGTTNWTEGGSTTANTTISGSLTGSGTLNYRGTATTKRLELSGNNAGFSGTINLDGTTGNRNIRLLTSSSGSASATWAPAAGNTLEVHGVSVQLGTLNGAGTVTNTGASAANITVGAGSFSGVISNGTNGMSLTKVGGGTLTLSGNANTYTGGTIVNGGTLVATQAGSIASGSTVQVNGSGTFDGTGALGAAVTVADASGTLRNGNGTSNSLTLSSLTFAGDASLNVVTSSATPSARIIVSGALATTPANGQVVVNGSGSWSNGVNNLLSFGSFSGSITDFTAGTFSGLTARQSAGSLSLSGSNLALTVIGDSPKWTGNDSGNWVVGTTGANSNWQLITAGSPTDFIANDNVLFDDTAPGPKTVSVSAANVSVASAEFNNTSSNYTLTGPFGISSGSIIKNGSGALTIENANSTSGGVQLNAGTLNVNNSAALGTGTLTINGGTIDNTSGSAVAATNAQAWNSDFTFNGSNNLTLGAAAMNASRTVTVGAGTLTVGGVSGTGFGLTKEGAGTLAIGASSYSGATTVNGGTLRATSTTSFGSTSSVTLANTAGVALDLNGNNQTIGTITGGGATGGNVVLNGAVLTTGTASNNTFSGALISGTGAGGLVKNGTGTLTLSGDKTGYTGTTTVNAGTLDLGTINGNFGAPVTITATPTASAANNSIVVGSGLFVEGNGLLTTGISGSSAGFGAKGGNLTVNVGGAGGMIDRSSAGANGLGQMIFGSANSDSRVIVQNNVGLNTFNVYPNGNTRDFTVNSGTGTASAEIAGVITPGTAGGVSGILKKGNGDLILSNANTFLGRTTIDAGRIVLGHAQALQFSTLNADSVGKLSVAGYASPILGGLSGSGNLASVIDASYSGVTTLTLNPQVGATQTYNGVIADGATGMSLVKSGAGTQVFNATQTYTGGTTINAGTLSLGHSTDTLLDAGVVTINGGTLALGANSDTVGAVTLVSGSITGTGTLTGSSYGVQGGSVSAILGGSGITLTKTTGGTVTLTGNNTYTGATTVSAGTLVVNGSLASGPVTVDAGATLAGIGTIGGVTTVNGSLNPGNSPGTLNFLSDLTLAGITNMEITGIGLGQFDVLNGNGTNTLTFGGTLALDNTGYTANLGDTVTIFTNWNSFSGTFASITGLDLGGGLMWDTSALASSGTLTVSAVPEPGSLTLLACAGIGGGIYRRLRNRKKANKQA